MNSVDNPYTPGAGTPPPELAGRESILKKAEDTIKRTKKSWGTSLVYKFLFPSLAT